MKTVLTIAGFDPSSGAGVTADLAVMAAHDLFGTSCITALTVQSTRGVNSWRAIGAAWVSETLACLTADLPPAGVKVGMLADESTVLAVADFLQGLPASVTVVLDPVLRSSSGTDLLEPAALNAIRALLLPRVAWVTPNMAELALLSGMPVETPAEMQAGALALVRRYPGLSVVATGGHLGRPDDLLVDPTATPVWLAGERVDTRSTHGTGCAFSTALLCGLVHSLPEVEAVSQAKQYVRQALLQAEPRGGGRGPMELFWRWRTPAD